ncbi:ATP-binding protein [candidate division KSB1 bacterium]|nr:MAG: ATP-binding protein [candidate division KSB1 bacterium]RKY88547.1 MAG: ATP-binding protein [candidate division KSB1 bacterium]
MDPRVEIIDERLKNIDRVIAVSGGKGGIGKSVIASTVALSLAKRGHKVGLLDLDFTSPSTHVILGIDDIFPEEEKGIVPPEIYGIKFMSIVYYTGDGPSPLRGLDISNAMIELLAITRWGNLDFLIVDSPPGIGDATLDTVRLMKKTEFLVVTTPSRVALATVKKVLTMLKELKSPIIGIVENMKITRSSLVQEELEMFNVPFLAEIDFDRKLENTLGDVNRLLQTNFARSIANKVIPQLTKPVSAAI